MEISYISALPGMGKTKWAVSSMASWSKEDKPSGYYMYVAPTGKLLKEVERYLKKRLPEALHSKIERIDTKTYGGRVVDQIQERLSGSNSKFGTTKKAPSGTIFLITHSAFLLMKTVPSSEKINLIFDEARKCVSQHKDLKIPPELRDQVFNLFNLVYINKSFSQAKAKHKVSVVAKKLDKMYLDVPTKNKLLSVAKATENPRLEAFFSNDKTSDIFEVILPSVIFDGFRSVTLMSAYFEDSQLYHLLKKRRVPLIDITQASIENYQKEKKLIRLRYSTVDMVVLFPDVNEVLSKEKLKSILVPYQLEGKIKDLFENLEVTSKTDLERLRASFLDPNFKGTPDVEKFRSAWLKNADLVQFKPIEWMISETKRIVSQWYEANPVLRKKALVIMNKSQKDEMEDRLPMFDVESTSLHGINKYLKRSVVAFLAAVNPSRKMISFYSLYLPGYEQAKDHVAEVCAQSVCRVNIRDTKSKKRTLVIVPDNGIAALLNEKLLMRPVIRDEYEPKTSLVAVGLKKRKRMKTRTTKALSSNERTKKWKNDPVNMLIGRLRARISYYKKANSDKLVDAQAQLEHVVRTRTIPKDLLALSKASKKRTYI